jgi:hypothetical protein
MGRKHTDLENLVLLCRRRHHGLHEEQFDIVALGQGRSASAGMAHAARSSWDGSRLDLDYMVAALAPGLRSVGRRRRYDPWAAA